MKLLSRCLLLLIIFSPMRAFSQKTDLSKDKVLYTIGYAHLDTEWRWDYQTTIKRYIWNTMEENFRLFEKYPHYVFNFSGANRYKMMKEYYPAQYDSVKRYIAAGRWFPCGSSMEESDVLAPSHESIIRQVLLGNNYFRKEFGVASNEYMLPDCFGFPASLPSILAHCGVKGFSTQKLTWGSNVGIPFNVGTWIGSDGQSIIAALNPGSYSTRLREDLNNSTIWRNRILDQGAKYGVYADYMYYGTGDVGGSPTEESVRWIEQSVQSSKDIRILSAKADQLFIDIAPAQKAKLPMYQGELLLTNHSAGSITSAAYQKRWNRKNELLADKAEATSVIGEWLGGMQYNRDKMNEAWRLVLGGQFHDILPGTSIPRAYDYAWNDEFVAANLFSAILADACGSVIRALDTRGKGVPVVVFNPLSCDREDVVQATVTFAKEPPQAVRIYDRVNKEVPAQLVRTEGTRITILFLAKTSSLSFATFDVRPSVSPCALPTGLKVNSRSLENSKYAVKLDDDGDVSSIVDKTANKELLSAPIRLAFQYERPENWPAWNMDWADRQKPPVGYVEGPAKIRIVENGPARIALEVERESRHSKFIQRIRLAANGERVEFNTNIDWATKESSLKAAFPFTVSNPVATYNFGVGTVQRSNNDSLRFEVPSHQWFDLTDKNGAYGVSVLEDCKYGSDKPADNVLRLTLLYTPGVRNSYRDQAVQDFGKHEMLYALYGHWGDWRAANSNLQGARLNQPLVAFQAPPHNGWLGKAFSFLTISNPDVILSAIKKAADSDDLIVRVVEAKGKEAKNVVLSFAPSIVRAREVTGQEQDLAGAVVEKGKLVFDITPYRLRTFAVRLRPSTQKLAPTTSRSIGLPFNIDAISSDQKKADGDFDGSGRTFPAEMIPETFTSENITYALGPKADGANNAVACIGQTIQLPTGAFNKLYILAGSTDTLHKAVFTVGGVPVELAIEAWSGFIGQWDRRIWDGASIAETNYDRSDITYSHLIPGYTKNVNVGFYTTHCHLANGENNAYAYAYMYKYRIDMPKGAREITLPSDNKIRVFAITAAYNENDDAVQAQNFFDVITRNKDEYERFAACSKPQLSPENGYIDYGQPLSVTLSSSDSNADIHYTLDGTTPALDSPRYTVPLSLTRTIAVKAVAFHTMKLPSATSSGFFSRSFPVRSVRYLAPAAQRRGTDTGERMLIDLVRATDVMDRNWQVFEKNDLDVILDLGQMRTLEEVTLSCLENNSGRVFLPLSVEISVSSNDKDYTTAILQNLNVPEKAQPASMKNLTYSLQKIQGRHIHVKAKNIGTLPSWHRNAGANALMGCDEITVE